MTDGVQGKLGGIESDVSVMRSEVSALGAEVGRVLSVQMTMQDNIKGLERVVADALKSECSKGDSAKGERLYQVVESDDEMNYKKDTDPSKSQ